MYIPNYGFELSERGGEEGKRGERSGGGSKTDFEDFEIRSSHYHSVYLESW